MNSWLNTWCQLHFVWVFKQFCIDCIASFSFNCDRLKIYFYFKIRVNGTDHTSLPRTCFRSTTQVKHSSLGTCQAFLCMQGTPWPGFLDTENSQKQDDKCITGAWSRKHKELATRHLVSLIYSGQRTLMKFTFECLKGTCLGKQCNC